MLTARHVDSRDASLPKRSTSRLLWRLSFAERDVMLAKTSLINCDNCPDDLCRFHTYVLVIDILSIEWQNLYEP
jgi:hypothetical protein